VATLGILQDGFNLTLQVCPSRSDPAQTLICAFAGMKIQIYFSVKPECIISGITHDQNGNGVRPIPRRAIVWYRCLLNVPELLTPHDGASPHCLFHEHSNLAIDLPIHKP
jgi:hypothetical protein